MATLIASAKLTNAFRVRVVDKNVSAALTSSFSLGNQNQPNPVLVGGIPTVFANPLVNRTRRTVSDLESSSTLANTMRYATKGGGNITYDGYFVTGQSYTITTVGNTNWNTIAGTTGVTYAIGSRFVANNNGVIGSSGKASLASWSVTSSLVCEFPTYIEIDIESLMLQGLPEGTDCVLNFQEGWMLEDRGRQLPSGAYEYGSNTQDALSPEFPSFITFRTPKFFRSAFNAIVSMPATTVLRIKQIQSAFVSASTVSAVGIFNPGKFAALFAGVSQAITIARKTAVGASALSSIVTTVVNNTRARLFESSLSSQFNTSITSFNSRIRYAQSTMSDIFDVVCSPYQFEGIVLNVPSFATLTANVTRIEMTYNLFSVSSILTANTRVKFANAAIQTAASTNIVGNRLALAQSNITAQSSLSCTGNKPMVIKSNGAGTFGLYGTVNATIQWPDGTETVATTPGSYSYDAGAVGTGIITIRGTVTKYGPGPDNATYAHNSASVYSFGDLPITHLDYAFQGYNFGQDSFVPAKLPTTITSLRGLFYGAQQYRGRIAIDGYTESGFRNAENWNVSNVTDMSFMFFGNANLTNSGGGYSGTGVTNWNVSNVTTMESMFQSTNISLTLSNWNTSSLTNIKNFMKSNVTSLYGQVLNWNVSNVTNMEGAFESSGIGGSTVNPTSFAAWNTSSATNMKNMFAFSTSDGSGVISGLSNWNTSNVTNMEQMFRSVRISTQAAGRLDNWDTGNVTNMTGMFQGVSETFLNNSSQDLRGWCVTLIATEPTNFTSASAWTYRPVWGTCPP